MWNSFRPGCEFGISRDHAQSLLIRKYGIAQHFITHVEFPLKFLDPFLGWLMRGVCAAGDIINKKGIIRSGRIQVPHMFDGFVGQVGSEVVTRIIYKWKYLCMVPE